MNYATDICSKNINKLKRIKNTEVSGGDLEILYTQRESQQTVNVKTQRVNDNNNGVHGFKS